MINPAPTSRSVSSICCNRRPPSARSRRPDAAGRDRCFGLCLLVSPIDERADDPPERVAAHVDGADFRRRQDSRDGENENRGDHYAVSVSSGSVSAFCRFSWIACVRSGTSPVTCRSRFGSSGYPACRQASKPPFNGRTSVQPASRSVRAARALDSSLGQLQ